MASGFVDQSRGRLEIESEAGKGTLIRMLFPVSHLQESVEDGRPRDTAIPSHDTGTTAAEHILVVEDSTGVLDLAKEILTAAGYRITTAESGEQALEIFENSPPDSFDLLFTDLVMPGGINGLVLAEEITKRQPDIAILMTTGYNEELAAAGPSALAKDVLGKPYRRSELLDPLRQALSNRYHDKNRRTPSDYGAAEA